jgi:hypothetical protein
MEDELQNQRIDAPIGCNVGLPLGCRTKLDSTFTYASIPILISRPSNA